MASAVFNEKRTRSQLTLPDDLLLHLPQGSPLKGARTALRHGNNHEENTSRTDEIVEETDDELLLSPGKPVLYVHTTKRPVSPLPRDDYAFRPTSPSEGRELKRTKLDDSQSIPTPAYALPSRLTHTRSHSQPGSSTRERLRISGDLTTEAAIKSTSVNSQTPGRAQSVPIFPLSRPSATVHIDLRNPPASPRRPGSRSPSKERELHIVPGAASIPKLDTIHDDAVLSMHIDQDVVPGHIGEIKTLNVLANPTITTASSPLVPSPLVPVITVETMDTPARPKSPMSPLTPLPETPLTLKPINALDTRIIGSGLEASLGSKVPDPLSPTRPTLGFAIVTKSRLPRPLSSTSLSLPQKDVSATEKQAASSSSKPLMSASRRTDAFAVLMANARGNKGKGKEKATVTKNGPSSNMKVTGGSLEPSQTKKVLDKGKGKEVLQPKPSLKNKMKPKAAVKPKVKLAATTVPLSLPDDNDHEEGDTHFSYPSSSAAHPPTPSGGTASPIQSPSQENIDLVIESGEPMDIDRSPQADPSSTGFLSLPMPSAGSIEPPSPSEAVASVESFIDPPISPQANPSSSGFLSLPVPSTASAETPSPGEAVASVESFIDPPISPRANPSSSGFLSLPEPSTVSAETPSPGEAVASVESFIDPPISPRADPSSSGFLSLAMPSTTESLETPSPREAVALVESFIDAPVTEVNTPGDVPATSNKDPLGHDSNSVAIQNEPTASEPSPTDRPANLPTSTSPQRPKSTRIHISKRNPTSMPPPTRITRSASLKKNMKAEITKPLPPKRAAKPASTRNKPPTARTSENDKRGSSSKPGEEDRQSVSDSHSAAMETAVILSPPGSPIPVDSPVKQKAKTPKSSFAQATKSTLAKQVSPTKTRPSSPNKPARSVSMVSLPRASLSRSYSSYTNLDNSSLSTLSTALEKLHKPPPERPSTSMGFNRDDPDSSFELKVTSHDDSSIKRSSTHGSIEASSSQKKAGSSRLVQRTLFDKPRSSLVGRAPVDSGTKMRGSGAFKIPALPAKVKPRIFGVGGGMLGGRTMTVQKASRKTSLPSVMASPLKGGDADMVEDVSPAGEQIEDLTTIPSIDLPAGSLPDKGKGKERATDPWSSDVSRRVSLASQALSQSLLASSSLMGPPTTPKGNRVSRSVSSTYPSSSSGETNGRTTPTRTSLRLAAQKTPPENDAASGSRVTPLTSTAESLKFLKDCVIFVDVRTDDGDEAGSLFVEMLEGVGARILTRVGQTCTHVVFKNGLMSTINRYRLLRDPKPHVVGIAWVVECVEQRKLVDEARFLVDLDGYNVSGTNKRRRSMLPKLLSEDYEERNSSDIDGDVSMDGSTSSITSNDELTPLEKARLRKAAAR
ncbi:hypothetical protein H0H93_006789 [Arthromyces matolae]|nr:hypothetical protein H0H93_006789 [Arthromyces matolae]